MKILLTLLLLWAGFANAQGETPSADTPSAAIAATAMPSRLLVFLRLPQAHFRADAAYGDAYGDGMGHAARRRIAAQLAREQELALVEDWPLPLVGVECYVMTIPPGRTADSVMAMLARDQRVAWTQVMNEFRAQARNDPLYPVQPAAQRWHLAELHAHATGHAVKVAVIDSGIDARHPDLSGQLLLSENFVDTTPVPGEAHGTAVAGIIAARADNGIGIVGIAPDARLMALRACWPDASGATLCSSLSIAKALHFAIEHSAQVINMSLSGPDDRLLGLLLDAARAQRITVIAAADRSRPNGGFPAAYPGVIAVADEAAGTLPEGGLRAPGQDVPTTVPGAAWSLVSGSSYAAAHVSGLFALLHELNANRTQSPLRTAIAVSPTGGVDSCATFARALGSCACGCALARSGAGITH